MLFKIRPQFKKKETGDLYRSSAIASLILRCEVRLLWRNIWCNTLSSMSFYFVIKEG